jgi:DNA-binding NarL/FixJ family response regulator
MPRTVLIVDDHASFRAAARMLLELEGYEVVGEAVDGEDGVRKARELQPDFVLLDVQMPGMNGFEVAARLTAGAGAPSVVLTSSHDSEDFGRMIGSSGARGFIPKAELSGDRIAALLP